MNNLDATPHHEAEETIALIAKHYDDAINRNVKLWATSSFQTQSIPLLHIIGTYFPEITIVFIDTGYLFAETYAFKNKMEKQFNLKIKTVASKKGYSEQTTANGLLMYSEDTERCCYTNKVEPLQGLVQPGDLWISGVRRDQSSIREAMEILEVDTRGVYRLHPMLHWNSRAVYQYLKQNNLPKHPLESSGYISIGCVPCTHKYAGEDLRGGRWVGSKKTECGLHTENRA